MALDFNTAGNWDQMAQNLNPGTLGQAKKSYTDDRFWKLSRNENEDGAALIRLLPDPSGTPFIKVYSHAIQSWDAVNKKKRWYLNTSPETIGAPCPASELWSAIYNSGSNEGKEEGKMFSRKMNYYVNILVVNDPLNPENNGQIRLWKFGTKLFDKFMAALNPSEQDRAMGETPKELFNPLTGNNIKLKIKKANGFFNYDDTTIEPATVSEFTPGVPATKESATAAIIEKAHKLSEFMEPASFKTYEESVKSLKWVTDCYTPKHLDPMMFKQIVEATLGSTAAESSTTTAATAPVINTGMDMATPAPVQAVQNADLGETVATPVQTPVTQVPETPTVVNTPAADDDLDFLNDMD